MSESNPIFEFAQLWESTKERAAELGLSLRTLSPPDEFALYDEHEAPVFMSTNLSSCSAFVDGVTWECRPERKVAR